MIVVLTRGSTKWAACGSRTNNPIIEAATSGSSPSFQIFCALSRFGSVHFCKWSRSFSPNVLLNHEDNKESRRDKPLRRCTDSLVYSRRFNKTGLIQVCKSSFLRRDFDLPSSVTTLKLKTSRSASWAAFTHCGGRETSERNSKLMTWGRMFPVKSG